MKLPRLDAVVDAALLSARGVLVEEFARALRMAGVSLVQYRAKDATPQAILRNAGSISYVFAGSLAVLIMNDRTDLAILAGWDGVHLGQEDLSPQDAKAVLAGPENPHLRSEMWGTRSGGIVGVSTHNEEQVAGADAGAADYVAIGPVFTTGTKLDAAAVVGLDGVRRARALTNKPLVAIGGITRENAPSVMEAGADSVAVISGLFVAAEPVEKVARDFLQILG